MPLNPADQIAAHCEMLHQCAEGIDGLLVVSVFYANPSGDADRPGSVTHHRVGDAEQMSDTIRAHLETPGANVYTGLQVMRKGLKRGARGAETDIVAVLGLVADMDADTGKVGELPFPPSYTIETSPGNEQPAWLFERPLSVAEARPLAAALRIATNSDAGTSDPVHVWRIPGTLNWPNKKKLSRGRAAGAADVLIKQEWAGDLVSIEDFTAALAPHKAAIEAAARDVVRAGELPGHVDVSAEITEMLAADGQPDRSAHAAKLIEKMAFAGHTLEEAVALVLNCTGEWSNRYASAAAAQKDVERLWAKFGIDREWLDEGAEIAKTLMDSFMARRGAHDAAYISPPAPDKAAPLIKATPFEWIDPKTLPRREFLFGTHLIRKFISVTVAPGGLGKSSLTIAEALAMVTGRPFFNGGLTQPLRVWMFNAEDPREELNRRIMGACLHYGLSESDLRGRLFVDSGREAEIVIAVEERDGFKIVRPVVKAVKATIIKNGIDVLIVDPFVSTHNVSENDNGAIDKVAKQWSQIADECNVAIDIVHHVRKVDGREVTVEDARGAVSLLAAARSARVLNRMSSEQSQAAGLTEDDRFQIFNVQAGKTSMAVMSSRLDWRRMVSVPLNNGAGFGRPQDHAGVVTQWEWPTTDAVLDGLTSDQILTIQARARAQEWREDGQSSAWVGNMVGEVLDIPSDAGGKKRLKAIVGAMLGSKQLVVEMRKDPKGQMRKFVNGPEQS